MRSLKIIYETFNEYAYITYLYDKEEKILLPIETYKDPDSNWDYVIKTLLNVFKGKLTQLEIYLYKDCKFYTYVNVVNKKGIVYKINCNISNSIAMAFSLNIPLVIKEEILYQCGIKISEDIINNALSFKQN